MNRRTTKYAVALALAAGAAVTAACSDTAPTQPSRYTGLHLNATEGTPGKKLVLCKEGTSGTFTANLVLNGLSGSLAVTNPFTVNAGQCIDVYLGRLDAITTCCEEPIDELTITETSAIPVSIRLEGVNVATRLAGTGTAVPVTWNSVRPTKTYQSPSM